MNVLKEMYHILYPEEIAEIRNILNKMLEQTQKEIKNLEEIRRDKHGEQRY